MGERGKGKGAGWVGRTLERGAMILVRAEDGG